MNAFAKPAQTPVAMSLQRADGREDGGQTEGATGRVAMVAARRRISASFIYPFFLLLVLRVPYPLFKHHLVSGYRRQILYGRRRRISSIKRNN